MSNPNKSPSPWEESQQHDPKSQQAAKPVHDGFEDSHPESHQDDNEVIDATPKNKGNPLIPKILVGVMGLAVVGVLGVIGVRLMNTMGGSKSASQIAKVQKAPATEIQRPVTGTVLMGDSTPATGQTASTQTLTSAAPAMLVQMPGAVAPIAAPPRVAPVAAMAQMSPVGAMPAAADVATPDPRLAQANERTRVLEGEVRSLREQLVRKDARVTGVATAGAGTSLVAVTPRIHHVAKVRAAKNPTEDVITETAEGRVPVEIARLQLRGVFPRAGDDMQAWLMDGDKTRSVSKGDMINGAKVIRVETDKVVTDLGVIR